jgi:hypothetical protein
MSQIARFYFCVMQHYPIACPQSIAILIRLLKKARFRLETGLLDSMEPATGIEPATNGLQIRCSTVEPRWHFGRRRRAKLV